VKEEEMEYMRDLRKAHQMSVVLHIAFMATIVIYAVIVEILRGSLQDFRGFTENVNLAWIRYIFFALGLAQIFFIRFMRDTLSKRMTSADVRGLIAHLTRISIISSALCEVPAFLGLVLFFFGSSTREFYVLIFISVVLFILYFPRYSNWEEWVKTRVKL
jgi:hypothetical protein